MVKHTFIILSVFVALVLLYVGSYLALSHWFGVPTSQPYFAWFLHTYYPLRVLEARQQNPPRQHTGTIRSIDFSAHRLMLSGSSSHPDALALSFTVALEPALRGYKPGEVLAVTYELCPGTVDFSLSYVVVRVHLAKAT